VALKAGTGRRLLLAGVAALAGYYAVWGGEYSAWDLVRIGESRREAEAALQATRREVDSLRALATKLEGDPATIERIARERFGMIREGELLYRFVPVDSGAAVAPGP
jgi:cell division protein FtsB